MTDETSITSVASSGMSGAQITADIVGALDNLQFGSDARLYLIAPQETVKVMAMAVGWWLANVPRCQHQRRDS
jgi:hypothetical protein